MTRKKKQLPLRVPYALSSHGKEEIDAVVGVLRGNTALGDNAKEFEKRVATLFGKKYGVMVNSGSSANLLAFELLNLPKGSEVITPLLTFSTTVAPIVQKGLTPVFVDIEKDTYLIDIKQIEKVITKKTKALMIPSLLGNIPNMAQLALLAKKHKLWFIEDSCDTLGGTYDTKPTGSYSHISTTSFYGSHIINGAGGGGMVCVNDKEWYRRLLMLRGWGRQSSLFGEKGSSELLKNRFKGKLSGIPYDNKFIFSEIGYNLLPLEISAAFALEQLKKLPQFTKARKKNYNELRTFFETQSTYFTVAKQTPKTQTAWLAFPVSINENAPFSRLEITQFLEKEHIQTRPVFTGNILTQPGFAHIQHRGPEMKAETQRVMRNSFVLGCHQGLTKKQIAYMQQKISEFLSRYR